jgi:hypothetical protein
MLQHVRELEVTWARAPGQGEAWEAQISGTQAIPFHPSRSQYFV